MIEVLFTCVKTIIMSKEFPFGIKILRILSSKIKKEILVSISLIAQEKGTQLSKNITEKKKSMFFGVNRRILSNIR